MAASPQPEPTLTAVPRRSGDTAATTVASSDGARIAVHALAGSTGGTPLLISHATGFHAHCYLPLARALAGTFRAFGLDHRGHGETPVPQGWRTDWRAFGVDTVEVAATIAPDGGLVGFGHSMGAAALLMAAHRDPGRFARLVLFEPIAQPPGGEGDPVPFDPESLPIVRSTRRRRRRFASADEALANYREKAPLSSMRADVLRLYVDHGLRPAGDGPGVELRCTPEHEASVFVTARSSGVWGLLPEIAVPTLVVSGAVEDGQPGAWAAAIAARLANGRHRALPHLTHIGPFSDPDEIAAVVRAGR